MKRIAEALDVARFRLAERMGKPPEKRPPRYSKEQDSVSLPFLREITDERATLGYRRATVVLNRLLAKRGLPPVNHKRIYRIMRLHGLLLTRHTGRQPERAHDGKVITLRRTYGGAPMALKSSAPTPKPSEWSLPSIAAPGKRWAS